jgi:hypothetical protein
MYKNKIMVRTTRVIGVILVSISVFFLAGCYKNRTVYLDTGEEITRPVSFGADIIPIFNASCNTSGCHSTGGRRPDLSPSNAFTSLQNGNYVNTDAPENSEIYLWMTGKKTIPMPPSGINRDNNALVLAWIKQGAQNN